MKNDFFYEFLCLAKDEKVAFLYSNLNSGSVLEKILQNKCGSKSETRIHKNDFENTQSTEPLYKNNQMFEYYQK
jgi:hypothetical protein